MTTDHWFNTCEKNIQNGHIRNILIKCTIIVIVQYTLREKVPLVLQFY